MRSVLRSRLAKGEDDAVRTEEEPIDADDKPNGKQQDDGAKAGKPRYLVIEQNICHAHDDGSNAADHMRCQAEPR